MWLNLKVEYALFCCPECGHEWADELPELTDPRWPSCTRCAITAQLRYGLFSGRVLLGILATMLERQD